MAYQARYRKYRPKDFEDVIGQEAIVKTLTGQIEMNRVSHAYLFCGTRGTGKTSTAKIFAKAVNCSSPVNGSPCGSCEMCVNIERSMNMVEIDAASNNGVDNIRDLREEVKYSPTEGKYKVYIIDEVHMLSNGAFNALLKTLEEPPAHVIFILATTDPQKIPPTILSRCQRFDFKRIASNKIADKLNEYMEIEHVEVDYDALKYIANISDGAMRDALSILDQCDSYFLNTRITLDKVLEVVGAVDISVFFKLTDALEKKGTVECLEILDDILANGRTLLQFIDDFIIHLRNLLVTRVTESNILDISSENLVKLKAQATRMEPERLMQLVRQFSDCQTQIKYSANQKTIVEVLLIKLTKPVFEDNIESLKERISILEKKIKEGVFVEKGSTEKKIEKNDDTKVKEIKNKRVINFDLDNVVKSWNKMKSSVGSPLDALLMDSTIGTLNDNFLYIVCLDGTEKLIDKKLDLIDIAFAEVVGADKDFKLKTISQNDFAKGYEKEFGDNRASNENPEITKILNSLKQIDFPIEEVE